MNTSKIKRILNIVAIISLSLSCIMFFVVKAESSLYIMYYLFDLIGQGLRKLSLSSTIGNIMSIFIYILISSIPAGVCVYKRKKGIGKNIDALLICVSVYLLYAIYKFINPTEFYSLLPEELYGSIDFITSSKLSISMMFYIILISYFVLLSLTSLSVEEESNKKDTLKSLQIILTLFLVSNIILIFYFGIFDILGKINASGFLFYITKYLLSVAPMIMSMLVIFRGIELINNFRENQYEESVVEGIKYIYEYSKNTVYICVISSLFINGMQLLLAANLRDINILLSVPFVPLIVAFVGIILCKYFKENNDLYNDNNSII